MSRAVDVCPHCLSTNWYRRTGGYGGRPAKSEEPFYFYNCQNGFGEVGTKEVSTTYDAAETLRRIGIDPEEAME